MLRSKPERALIAAAAFIAALVIAALSVPAALAQSYPERPIRLVIPFAAGGPNDLIGRPLAEKMSEALGQPIVIENKGQVRPARSAPHSSQSRRPTATRC